MKTTEINEKIGILPIITPYVKSMNEKVEGYKHIKDDIFLYDIPTIAVEGKTDKETFEFVILKKYPLLNEALKENRIRFLCSEDHGGTTQLTNWVKAWGFSGFKNKLLIVTDKDKAGIKARKDICNDINDLKLNNTKCMHICPSTIIKEEVLNNIKDYEFEIEHLFSLDFWKKLKEKGYINKRSDNNIKTMLEPYIGLNDTYQNVMKLKITNEDVRDTIFSFEPHKYKKVKILKLAKEAYEAEPESDIFDGFSSTINEIEKYFQIS
jgi:5S rRNA maturation endonuclease (ribonuclease M5)